MSETQKRATAAFVAGFALCFVMTRVLVTNDATWQTWLSAIVIPMGIGRALR